MGKCPGHPFLNFLDPPLIPSYEGMIYHTNIYVDESYGVSIHMKPLGKPDFFTVAITRNERLGDG